MEFDRVIENRHSIRKFKSKEISLEKIAEIIGSAYHAPAAGGIPTVSVILVSSKETKAKIADAALGQNFVSEAPHILVVCSRMSQLKRSFGNRAEMYSKQQAGAAIQNILLKITEMGFGACWVGDFEENAVKRALKIPEDVNVEAIIPLGYSFEKFTKDRGKIDLRTLLFFDEWNKKFLKEHP